MILKIVLFGVNTKGSHYRKLSVVILIIFGIISLAFLVNSKFWSSTLIDLTIFTSSRLYLTLVMSSLTISCNEIITGDVFCCPVPELDEWLRRRIRMCYWKQWRRYRKHVRELLKLECSERHAVLAVLSRKASWRLPKTLVTQVEMLNQWLKKQGVISISELWISFHYPNNTVKPS